MRRTASFSLVLLALFSLLWPAGHATAQGVTTSAVTGVVKDEQGAAIPGATVSAVHQPSGTTYEAVTQADGRFSIQGMRIGGPYTVTAVLSGFRAEAKSDISLTLGVVQDVSFALALASVAETVTVTGETSPVFSSTRTGAATSVSRDELKVLPTVSGRINDITRLTPQYGGSGTFAGQDNRMNNITVDGSSFNNSFGLAGQPGDRTGVAPISLEAIEQVQVNVAPFDVRQGSFVGAGVNTVTRSGTNRFTASVYHRFRNESFVGTEAKGLAFNPGDFETSNTGVWAGGPIIRNKLFAFGSFENQSDTRPLSTFVANAGGQAAAGNVTRVLASDLNRISALLSNSFDYETGPYEGVDKLTPAKPFLVKGDYNLNNSNKISFRYSQLDSSTDQILSTSSSLGFGRSSGTNTTFLGYKNSNYSILEDYRSGIGEWNSTIGSTMSNSLMVGYTTNDESRGDVGTLFPFVDILDGAGVAYTALGSEPFTPNNELRYNTLQFQNSFTKYTSRHTLTFGASAERYRSENVFFPGKQSAYVYNTLSDFYTDLDGYLANPNRTTSPVSLRRFQVRYTNIPGQEKPIQPLSVWYSGGYAQDVWRPRPNVTLTAGLRMDIAEVRRHRLRQPQRRRADLPRRNRRGGPVRHRQAARFEAAVVAAPRLQLGRVERRAHAGARRHGCLHRQARLRLDLEPDWQHRHAHRLHPGREHDRPPVQPEPGFLQARHRDRRARGEPRPRHDRPGLRVPADLAQQRRCRPAGWRWGLIGTVEYIYNRDVNGVYYINANLPAAQSAFVGADNRPRWTGTACGTPTVGPVRHAPQQRRRQPGHQRHGDQEPGHRPLLELRGQPHEDAAERRLVQDRLQLRRVAQHHRCRVDCRGLVHRQPAERRSEQPGPRVLVQLAGTSLLHRRLVLEGLLQLR